MTAINKISDLVKNQFPSFYREDGEAFLDFVQAYYEYLEQTGKLTDSVENIQSYRDINTTLDEYIEYFRRDLLPSIPTEIVADKRILAKYIKDFNQSRGSKTSYKLLFRILYNEDVELNYPADQILKVSDGDWRIDQYLVTNYDSRVYDLIGKTIKGNNSQAEALVEDVVKIVVRNRDLMQIIVSNVKGEFSHLEPVIDIAETSGTPFAPKVEAGIKNVTIIQQGAKYEKGDVVDLISSDLGNFAKVVVTDTVDLNGALTFSIVSGGSGYTASGGTGTQIEIAGGDGTGASFQIDASDIVDTFALAINTNLISSNTIYGTGAPVVTFADGVDRQMNGFANVIIGASSYGFPEEGEVVTGFTDYHDHANAIITIANTSEFSVGESIFGATSSANGYITEVVDTTAGAAVLRINGYRNFTSSENVTIDTSGGSVVGTVSSFSGNTVGYHVLQIANNAGETLSVGDELVSITAYNSTDNAFGVIKEIHNISAGGYVADGRDIVYCKVTANNSANVSNQFDTGPLAPFLENSGVRLVGSATSIGNVVITTSNTVYENMHTRLRDSLTFEASTFGTIAEISLPTSGSGYSIAPTINLNEPSISSLGIGEQYITLQSDDVNWGTGNSSFTKLDTNDKVVQANTGATGHVKAGATPNAPVEVVSYANGTYEMVVRVWQDFLQRSPGNISYANNDFVDLNIFDSSYVQGVDADERSIVSTGTAKIVSIDDRGILGQNADIRTSIGANGSITGIRVLDSGFSYKQGEIVTLETPDRTGAVSGTVQLNLSGAANSEGYYASTRSHISSLRGYIQDSDFYQEFSYEVIVGKSLNRWREVALDLVHPAGQKLFGKYRLQTNNDISVVANTNYTTNKKSAGTFSISNGSFDITGSGTSMLTEYANNDYIILNDSGDRYTIQLNIVDTNTAANTKSVWTAGDISGATAYYAVTE